MISCTEISIQSLFFEVPLGHVNAKISESGKLTQEKYMTFGACKIGR